MESKTLFPFRTHLHLLVHSGSGNPHALRLNVRKVVATLSVLALWLTLSLLGTLLFFRELELNRQLADRLLEVENRARLGQTPMASTAAVASTSPAPNRAPAKVSPAPSVPAAMTGTATASLPSSTLAPNTANTASVSPPHVAAGSPAAPKAEATNAPAAGGQAFVNGRVGDFSADCVGEECEARIAILPTGSGIAQGQLLVILETEIPRIGGGSPSTQVRKRYFIYPGNQIRDELTPNTLNTLERKTFKFSRALQATAQFNIGKLLRPLALNVYLYDSRRTLIRHERKVIETEE